MFYWSPNRFPRRSPSLFGLKSGTVTATVLSEGLLQFNGDTGEITLLGGTTYGRTSGGYVQDYAGTYTLIAEGYPRIQGARYSGNTPYYTLADGTPLHPMRGHNGSTFLDTYPVWTANTVYAANARVIPTSGSGTAGGDGYWYYASTGGTSHATTEPIWAAGPVSDNTAAWTRGGYYRIAGYLHEQSATNTVLYSGALSNVAWTKSGSSISAGTLTSSAMGVADKIVEDGASSQHYVTQTLSWTGGVTYTFWAVLKADGRNWVNMYSSALGGGAYFNVSTGTIGNVSTVTATLSPLPTGEYLCAITGTKSGTGSADIGLYLGSANGTNNYAGDGSSGIYAAHVQVNVGNFPMSPIITTSETVTRAADSLTLPASVFSNTAGTLVADVQHALWSAAAGQVLGDGTEYVLGLATDVSGAKAYDGTNTVSGPAGTPAGVMRQAVRWASTALQLAANGTAETAGTYDESFNLSSLVIGSSFNGLIKNFRIYRSDQGADTALAALSAKETS